MLGIAHEGVRHGDSTGTIANSFTERGDFHTTTGTGHHVCRHARHGLARRDRRINGHESNATAARCLSVALAIKRAPLPAVLEQESYRFRNDDGTEVTATWQQAANTPATVFLDTVFRLRFAVENSGEKAFTSAYVLEYRRKPSGGAFGSWGPVGHGGASKCGFVQLHGSDRDDTADQFRHVQCWRDPEVDDHVGPLNHPGATWTEIEFCLWTVGAQGAVAGDTYEIRIASLNTYTQTASLVAVPKPPRRTPFARVRLASG